MQRRSYFIALATVLAGCSEESQSGNPNTTPTDSPRPTSTGTPPPSTTAPPTDTRTEAPEPAKFEVTKVNYPNEVKVGEGHTFEMYVENTGEQAGTFRATLEVSTEDSMSWVEVGEIEIQDVGPGETGKYTSGDISFDEPYRLEFRLVEYDYEWRSTVVAPQPTLNVGATKLLRVDVGYETRPMAGVLITNNGDAPTKQVSITADWLDSSGSYIASSTGYLKTVGVNETWAARIDPHIDVDNYATIDDFEVSIGDVQPATSLNPEGVELTNGQLRASESQVIVRGEVNNTRNSMLDYIAVVAKVYNGDGNVIGWEYTNELDIEAGSTLRFELEPDTKGRNANVESYEIVLSDSTL